MGENTKICPVCKQAIQEGQAVKFCPECGTVHHAGCWDHNGGCATPNCAQGPKTAPQAAPQAAPSQVNETINQATAQVTAGINDLKNTVTGEVNKISEQTNVQKPVIFAALGAVAVVALIVLIGLFSVVSGGPKTPVKKYMAAFKKGDVKTMAYIDEPKECVEDSFEDLDYDLDEFIDGYKEVYKTLWSSLKDEGKVKVEYKIKNCEKLGKLKKLKGDMRDYDIKDLDDFTDRLDDNEEYDSMDTNKIKKAYAVEFTWTVYVKKDKAAKGTCRGISYKYKGKWYFTPLTGAPEAYSVLSELDTDDYEDVIEDVHEAMQDFYKDVMGSGDDDDE